ncbi:replication initiator protein [Blackfly microvirus SF02]|uniref:Replication initiator protein n=1 Tax=Blackfly microvirus SF02 TaxID=2576452 RepID=A0A4P8PKP1_9VIRU|nr:replication initiator protein [Blackfly microvirus SF02]
MTCYHPTPTWRSRQVNSSGKRSLVFSENQGIDGTRMDIPCGGCIGCRLDRAADWQTRLIHESQDFFFKAFITCTYSSEHLPADGSLNKKHFQDFLKRLRKKIEPQKIRFFACGEYGENLQRPHYHALIFGYDFPDKKIHSKNNKTGDILYTSKLLEETWGKGFCTTGSVTPDSCGYVSRYMMKKVRGDAAVEHYRRVNTTTGEIINLLPEYIHMSTKPGIGHNFYEKHSKQIQQQDDVIINKTKRRVPPYYDKLTAKQDPELLEWLKFIRAEAAKTRAVDTTDERLAVREEIKKSKTINLRRSL